MYEAYKVVSRVSRGREFNRYYSAMVHGDFMQEYSTEFYTSMGMVFEGLSNACDFLNHNPSIYNGSIFMCEVSHIETINGRIPFSNQLIHIDKFWNKISKNPSRVGRLQPHGTKIGFDIRLIRRLYNLKEK